MAAHLWLQIVSLHAAVTGQFDVQAGTSQPLDDVVQYLVEADGDAKQDVQTSASVFKPGWEVKCLPTCSHSAVCCPCKRTALQLPHAVKAACGQANWYHLYEARVLCGRLISSGLSLQDIFRMNQKQLEVAVRRIWIDSSKVAVRPLCMLQLNVLCQCWNSHHGHSSGQSTGLLSKLLWSFYILLMAFCTSEP